MRAGADLEQSSFCLTAHHATLKCFSASVDIVAAEWTDKYICI